MRGTTRLEELGLNSISVGAGAARAELAAESWVQTGSLCAGTGTQGGTGLLCPWGVYLCHLSLPVPPRQPQGRPGTWILLCSAIAHVQLLICSVQKHTQSMQLARHCTNCCAFAPQAEDESPMYVWTMQTHAHGGPRAVPAPSLLRGVSLHEDVASPLYK